MSGEPEKLAPTVHFGQYVCDCYRTSYPAGGATALYLVEKATEEPIATAVT